LKIGFFLRKWNKLRIGTNFENGTTFKLEEISKLDFFFENGTNFEIGFLFRNGTNYKNETNYELEQISK
jgi:hypothetical protein